MRIFEQFNRVSYDIQSSRIPVTFLYGITTLILLFLQAEHEIHSWQIALLFGASISFSVVHWFSTIVYARIHSWYFVTQAFFVTLIALATPTFVILVLVSFGAILVVQSFYFYFRLRQFHLFLLGYLSFAMLCLYFAYGRGEWLFYVCILCFALVLVFLIVTIFNQKELENLALVAANKRIEQLTRQNERQRMARDLHDSLIQRLIALNLKMDVMDVQMKKARYEDVERLIAKAKGDVAYSIQEARQVVEDLRLQEDTLSTTDRLFEEAEQLQFLFQLQITLYIDLQHTLNEVDTLQLLAIMKEAVTNAYKHSGATAMTIHLYETDMYHFVLHDNGQGFQWSKIRAQKKRFGLTGMQERAQLLNGEVTFKNKKGALIYIRFKGSDKVW